ncbi:MAG: acetyl-CoA C-acyltransferase [Chloroflexi bacterium]|nr:acetyl-CoA C-acyltransferase [Chloroflexota bacterium]MCI0576042.1 acetyl-CoA C-acyltransferase [Chloroflexota bacterium]MCI0647830.1 acetyl-CoA C-acyltransferase [Chloroflexota bacterium]MCI0727081.1 acetyl-CoA C-acyltransferase [Chloroflexota bacterium]
MEREAVIVAGSRTAVGRAKKGSTRNWRSDEMAAAVIRDLLRKAEGLDPAEIDDVIIGCAMPEGAQGLNFARLIALRAGLPVDTAGMTVNRFCSSGLQTIAIAAERIIANGADCIIAGGAETMSLVPMIGFRTSPNPGLVEEMPEAYMSMGLTAERVSEEFEVSRQAQDEFSVRSHQKAAAAYAEQRFKDEIVPIEVEEVTPGAHGPERRSFVFDRDEHLRPDTTLEGLAKLKPVFKRGGTVTAGNSSPLSDGAAAVIVMERKKAQALGLKPLLKFVGFAVAGVRPEIMGVGPVAAIPRLLKRTGLSLDDMELIELNEAFAAQAVAVVRELGMDEEKLNVNGGAIALGHPLGCSGAKLSVQILHEMKRRNAHLGMVTMCIGGGMGAAGIFENLI